MRFGRTVAVVVLLASRRAAADDASDASDVRDVDDVRVRGQAPGGFVSSMRVEDAPREVTDAASLIEPLPGVHVRRLGSDDSFATLSIRGSTSSQVAVFLAGVPLSGGADPTLDLATLPLWPGAGARVHRTFAPAALGRGSLGGTLVIDPPSPRTVAKPRSEVWAAAGSFGALRMRVGDVRGDPDGVRVATGLSLSRSDDDFSYLDYPATLAANRDVYTTRQNAGHAAAAGLASIAIPVRLERLGAGALTVTTLAQARRQELPGAALRATPLQRLDSSRLVSSVELTFPLAGGAWGMRGWGRREGLALTDSPNPAARPGGAPFATDDVIVAAGASVGWRGVPIDSVTLELRMDGSGERFAPGAWLGGVAPPAARRGNAGAALDVTARLRDRATVAMSARSDTWTDSADDGTGRTESRPTGNVGVEVPVGPVILATHAGFVARPPSFVERYGNRGAFLGEPNLRPESAFTVDAGGRVARRTGPLRWSGEVAGFATSADDLITYIYAGADGRAKATNIGRARLYGLEAVLRAGLFGFDARVAYTGLVTANLSECAFASVGVCERPPLPGRPEHDVVGDLAFVRGPVRVRYGVDVVSGIHTDLDGTREVPARVLHSAGIRLRVPGVPGLSLSLDLRNLFDLRVAEYAGIQGPVRAPIGDLYDYPLPGRRILLSARFTTENAPEP